MANVCGYGRFTHAVVRTVPADAPGMDGEVDVAKLQRQYGVLVGTLRQKVGLQVVEIPPDTHLPDSWRIEDAAVVQGDTALITHPLNERRHPEVRPNPPPPHVPPAAHPPASCVYRVCCLGRGGEADPDRAEPHRGGDGR